MAFKIDFSQSLAEAVVNAEAPAPPSDMTLFHIAGWSSCGFFGKAKNTLLTLQTLFPLRYKVEVHEFGSRDEYRTFMAERRVQLSDPRAHNHTSSPFVCTGGDLDANPASCEFLGGCDDTLDMARQLFSGTASKPKASMIADGFSSTRTEFDYDLVVIGGGSGGLAASKEAARLGAKVAVLDFVKPSNHGTTWGLGGTCVNVGCIPKKLMHQASLIGEVVQHDAAHFGWVGQSADGGEAAIHAQHSWDKMVSEVQQYIKGLNFSYRVALRDANVKYINGLAEFVGEHELKYTEFKGKAKTPKESTITSARFLIATGGRPNLLSCEGAEHAITSDDLFSLKQSPGKTCVVGAGYVALECAGFLTALGLETTVLVRSLLLRGFDRECCDKIEAYMTSHGTNIVKGVTPQSIAKQADGKLVVTYSNGSSDTFDTVLAAVGRTADTAKLNLAAVGLDGYAAKNGKLDAPFEQTPVPHVYAIGDVLVGKPELTPVAIQAGLLLARRLYDGKTEAMDYDNVATAVFTPIEYGTVGLSEDDAIDKLGLTNIEVYHGEFAPLEWSLSSMRDAKGGNGFVKVICDKTESERVIGMHYLGPNAGEVIQGYATAIRKGIIFADLKDTVGIHPTTAENFTTLTVTKSSGVVLEASGC